MNRAEKRRQKKLTGKAAGKATPGQGGNRSPEGRTQAIRQSLERAVEHHNAGALGKAEGLYRRVLEADPDDPVALQLLGMVNFQRGRHEAAVELITKALARKPDYADAHSNLGNALRELGRVEEAAASYQKAIAIDPGLAEAHYNLGITLQDAGRLEDAAERYHKAIAVNPDYAEAHYNLGNTFNDLGQLDAAVASLQTAIATKPDYAEAHYNLGIAFQNSGGLEKAVASYRKAIAIQPGYAEAHLNLSILLLLQGHLKEGWEEYEWRLKTKDSITPVPPIEMWPGSSLRGKNIFVYGEQGIGDELMFASCLPDLLEQSPKKIFLDCDPRLEALFARSFPGVHVCGRKKDLDPSWVGKDVQLDYSLPIGHLPKFFRNRVEDFPGRDAYLTPDPKLAEKWAQRLAGLKEGLKIGVSWRGGKQASIIRRASIPLPDWKPLLSVNASFVNLQYGDVAEDIAMVGDELNIRIHDWEDNDPLKDLDNQAALISSLDLVISIDNATVHMAGALGTRTWALLELVPDWRWPEAFGDSPPLYRSVRLFRQKRLFEWDDVIDTVERSLKGLIGNTV